MLVCVEFVGLSLIVLVCVGLCWFPLNFVGLWRLFLKLAWCDSFVCLDMVCVFVTEPADLDDEYSSIERVFL